MFGCVSACLKLRKITEAKTIKVSVKRKDNCFYLLGRDMQNRNDPRHSKYIQYSSNKKGVMQPLNQESKSDLNICGGMSQRLKCPQLQYPEEADGQWLNGQRLSLEGNTSIQMAV